MESYATSSGDIALMPDRTHRELPLSGWEAAGFHMLRMAVAGPYQMHDKLKVS